MPDQSLSLLTICLLQPAIALFIFTLFAVCQVRQPCLCRRKAGTEGPSLTFSGVIGPSASQADVFRATAAPMVQRLLTDGGSSTMIAYGMIGAGKTFTMEVRQQPQHTSWTESVRQLSPATAVSGFN